MQIVINIDDKTYKDIKEENSIYGINYGLSVSITGKVVGAIQSGTPLPKGHGRLKDVDKLELSCMHSDMECYGDCSRCHDRMVILRDLEDAPTIIELETEAE